MGECGRGESGEYRIAQISDIHCGDGRFDGGLLRGVIDRLNAEKPDLVAIVGDLTTSGYRDEFEEAFSYLGLIECPEKVIVPGNHDSRNVGYVHYKQLFGDRFSVRDLPFGVRCGEGRHERIRIVAGDASIPDLNDGEVGREHYRWLRDSFVADGAFKLFVVHHHLVSVPGTGRERNIVWDAGDVLEILDEHHVDLVLSGHKHVPYVWPLGGMLLVTSGTCSTRRTRGLTSPSYNMVRVTADEIVVEVRQADADRVNVFTFPRALTPQLRERTRGLEAQTPDPHQQAVGALG